MRDPWRGRSRCQPRAPAARVRPSQHLPGPDQPAPAESHEMEQQSELSLEAGSSDCSKPRSFVVTCDTTIDSWVEELNMSKCSRLAQGLKKSTAIMVWI